MLNNKGQGRSFWIIVTMIIALVVVVIVIMLFKGGAEKGFGFFEKKIGELEEDTDGDGVSDAVDECPCDPDVGKEFTEQKRSKDDCTPCV